mgnify:CR=1 FL=1
MDDKYYYRESKYQGGLKKTTLRNQLEKRPEYVIEHAVKGMLPHNRLGRQLNKKLKVYAGSDHPHAAQQQPAGGQPGDGFGRRPTVPFQRCQASLQVIDLLLVAGADVNLKDAAGRTALARATLAGHPAVVVPSGFRAAGTPRSISVPVTKRNQPTPARRTAPAGDSTAREPARGRLGRPGPGDCQTD